MAAGQETAGRIDRQRPGMRKLHPIIDIRHEGMAILDKFPALPVPAKTQVFIGLDLGGGVGVMKLDEVKFFKRIRDPGHPVGQDRRRAAAPERMDARIFEPPVIPGALMRQ